MASVQKIIFLSSVSLLVATLVACGKPSIRSKTMDAPSPLANPEKAEVENKAADDAAKDAATRAAANGDDAARASAQAEIQRKKTAREAAIRDLTAMMSRDGVTAADLEKARSKVAEVSEGLPPEVIKEIPEPEVTPARPAAVKLTEVETATRRAFAIAMIEPVMRANFQVFLARHEVLRLKAKVESNSELSNEEAAWLETLRAEYLAPQPGSEDKYGFNAILERVDGVPLSFLAAPLALGSNWVVNTDVATDKIVQRIFELNTSPSDDKLRFRSARSVLKQAQQEESHSLMKAFLNYPNAAQSPALDKILSTVTELLQYTLAESAVKEVDRVGELLKAEYESKNPTKP